MVVRGGMVYWMIHSHKGWVAQLNLPPPPPPLPLLLFQ